MICPHCGATNSATLERDHYGAYRACLRCGHHQEVDAAGKPLAPLPLIRQGGRGKAREQTRDTRRAGKLRG